MENSAVLVIMNTIINILANKRYHLKFRKCLFLSITSSSSKDSQKYAKTDQSPIYTVNLFKFEFIILSEHPAFSEIKLIIIQFIRIRISS